MNVNNVGQTVQHNSYIHGLCTRHNNPFVSYHLIFLTIIFIININSIQLSIDRDSTIRQNHF